MYIGKRINRRVYTTLCELFGTGRWRQGKHLVAANLERYDGQKLPEGWSGDALARVPVGSRLRGSRTG